MQNDIIVTGVVMMTVSKPVIEPQVKFDITPINNTPYFNGGILIIWTIIQVTQTGIDNFQQLALAGTQPFFNIPGIFQSPVENTRGSPADFFSDFAVAFPIFMSIYYICNITIV